MRRSWWQLAQFCIADYPTILVSRKRAERLLDRKAKEICDLSIS
jgi:hypothetical protein